jgi:succinate dehydrogenase flavin-adding protein (antitoxin of CptAB toxin-antitoxin module)
MKKEIKTSQQLIQYIKDNDLQALLFEESKSLEDEHVQFFGKIEQKEYVVNSDTMYCVLYFADHDLYLMITGEYDSYGSGEHDYYGSITEVKPYEKTITEYK